MSGRGLSTQVRWGLFSAAVAGAAAVTWWMCCGGPCDSEVPAPEPGAISDGEARTSIPSAGARQNAERLHALTAALEAQVSLESESASAEENTPSPPDAVVFKNVQRLSVPGDTDTAGARLSPASFDPSGGAPSNKQALFNAVEQLHNTGNLEQIRKILAEKQAATTDTDG